MERWEREGTERVVLQRQIGAAPVSPLDPAAQPESPGAARGRVLLRACRGTAAVVRRCCGKAGTRLNPKVPRCRCRSLGSCARKGSSCSRLDCMDGSAELGQKPQAESSHLCPAQHPHAHRQREESPALLCLHESSSCSSALVHRFLGAMRAGVPRNTYCSARVLLLFVAPGSF